MSTGSVGPSGVDQMIGERVHIAMWRAGVTQSQLARAIHVDQGSVSKRLRGLTPWKVSEVITAAELCGVDFAELMPTHDELGLVGSMTRGNGAAESRCTPAWAEDTFARSPLDEARQRWGAAEIVPGDGVAA
jgi:transcriptional regulator with XRE-family HTH domain